MLVQFMFFGTRRVIWNDRQCAFVFNGLAKVVGIIGGVGHDHLCFQTFDQGRCLRNVATLSGGEGEAHRTAKTPHGQVYLGAQATARTTKGLIFRPPFLAPEAC